jgi:hypothetical protein
MITATDRVIVLQTFCGLCYMQVCAAHDATDDDVLATCNLVNPSGTSAGWVRVRRDDVVTCETYPDRVHLMVGC